MAYQPSAEKERTKETNRQRRLARRQQRTPGAHLDPNACLCGQPREAHPYRKDLNRRGPVNVPGVICGGYESR